MTSVPHTADERGAHVPPIVLPITSRGLLVTDRVCWAFLGLAMVVAAAAILYLNRGTTFNGDEIQVVVADPHLTLREVLKPINGHLGATATIVYKALLEVFGATYLPFRILHVALVALAAGLFYALAKRYVGAVIALAPTLVLLFLGTDWAHVGTPVGFTVLCSVAAGLGALLALERQDTRGDAVACVLLVLSIATFSTGLAFLVGAAVLILCRPDARRHAWVFLVPVALYAAWWLWALSLPSGNTGDENTQLSNLLNLPSYYVDSLAAVTAAITGLGYDFAGGAPPKIALGWGYPLAAAALLALALRIKRGNVPPLVWAALAIVLVYWTLGTLAISPLRPPGLTRYIYLSAAAVLLVGVAAASSVRLSRLGVATLFALVVLSIASNLAFLRNGTSFARAESASARARLTMLELARGQVDEGFRPVVVEGVARANVHPDEYFAAVDAYGSPAFDVGEVERQGAAVRVAADDELVAVLGLELEPSPSAPPGRCVVARRPEQGIPVLFELPPGGATLVERGSSRARVAVGRFGDGPSIDLGTLETGRPATLEIPADSSTAPWRVAVRGPSAVEVCEPA